MGLFSGKRPTNLGVKKGRLADCPKKPNAVSSHAEGEHFIAPLAFADIPEKAWKDLAAVLAEQPGIEIVHSSENYIYAECKTPGLGFVDDLEFYLPVGAAAIQVRSASRLGYSDFGKNRQRMESIREAFLARGK